MSEQHVVENVDDDGYVMARTFVYGSQDVAIAVAMAVCERLGGSWTIDKMVRSVRRERIMTRADLG